MRRSLSRRRYSSVDWQAYLASALERHDERLAARPVAGERDDLRLGNVASASWAAGLGALMQRE